MDAGRLKSHDYDGRLARIIRELRERGLDADRAAATAKTGLGWRDDESPDYLASRV